MKHEHEHEHSCTRCGRTYNHDGGGKCRHSIDRLCDSCWDIHLEGALHPNFGLGPPAPKPKKPKSK